MTAAQTAATLSPEKSGPATIAAAAPKPDRRAAAVAMPGSSGQERQCPICGPEPASMPAFHEYADRTLIANFARLTGGLSPAAVSSAYLDWAIHLMASPGKQTELVDKAFRKWARLMNYLCRCGLQAGRSERCIEPLPQDKRFNGDAWQAWPFNLMSQAFLLNQQWWHNATTGIRGVSKQHENMVEFGSRQILDMFSPSNFIASNPQVLRHTFESGGANLSKGLQNLQDDLRRLLTRRKPAGADQFEIGRDLAVTPGKVIFRNHLIELIQYAPATKAVRPEPVLLVPAWIMKYYILDLSPENSLVRYLTQQGYTVFAISWRNPISEDRDLGLEDYRTLGVMAALDAIGKIVPGQNVHAVGYCLGGTLLSIAAAAMARDGDERLKSITLLAAQVDFREAGELMLFINESQIAFLESVMWERGYLDAKQMAGAFQMLHSNDLVWSRMIRDYLMGERENVSDLMAWNADATRMPYRMHSEYLRRLFLQNDLAEGRYMAGGEPVALSDIRAPIFSVGTQKDHVAPWRSTYKIRLLTDTDVTYLLTSGGHNAGIVSEPGHNGRFYQLMTHRPCDHYVDPDTFADQSPRLEGSWWPAWVAWLDERSGAPVPPPPMGAAAFGLAPVCDAPGTYVLQD